MAIIVAVVHKSRQTQRIEADKHHAQVNCGGDSFENLLNLYLALSIMNLWQKNPNSP